MLDKVHYKVDGRRGLEEVLVITDGDKITVADLHGEIPHRAHPPRPRRDLRRERPTLRPVPPDLTSVTEVLMQNRHRCPET